MGRKNKVKRAICLISGGMDSALLGFIAKKIGYQIYALTFDYGQRHKKEIRCAKKISRALGVKEHRILKIDLRQFGGSALTSKIKVPTNRSLKKIKYSKEIPITYVPARNTIFLSLALAYAEIIKADAIFIGANCLDYSGYPDCRSQYFKEFQRLANLATKRTISGKKIEIKYPILYFDKKKIVKEGIKLGVPFEYTWSCYEGNKRACGKCDSCVLRLNGFERAGYKDPIEYESQ